IKVEHIYREGNKAADFLAARGRLPLGVHFVSIDDPTLSLYLLHDLHEVSQFRSIMNEM
ncbi:hypothetical protein LINGRAHAP2_LOCUS8704, partial [Linum grandiflorum]